MKEIKLTKNKIALVGDEDFLVLKKYKWQISTNGYVQRKNPLGNGIVYMHRDILGDKEGFEIDHKNGNKLDNQRSNLRYSTRSQNNANQKKTRGGSQFKGVSFSKVAKKWHAYINKDDKRFYLGLFIKEMDAAKAYNDKAVELFGEFARENKLND